MRRLLLWLLPLLVAGGLSVPASAAVDGISVAELQKMDVLAAPGATLTADERTRLEAAASDLAAKGFPTKFIAVPAPAAGTNLDSDARSVRNDLAGALGNIDKIDAVILLAPRSVGVSVDAFASEVAAAFEAEKATFAKDRAAGAINLVNRLQKLDAAAAIPGDTSTPDKGISPVVWILGGVVIALGLIAMAFARRAAARGVAARADGDAAARAADDGAPPPELRQ